MFPVYLQLGFEHIADLEGYDHILFLVALCAVFSYKDWKKILVLATAFTIGHSITLALSALDILRFDSKLIEILIPVTILLTALKNLFFKIKKESLWDLSYLLPLFFGLIHGMGFSTFFKSSVKEETKSSYFNSAQEVADTSDVTIQLLAFNLGVELGQILIVMIFMLLNFICIRLLKVQMKWWTYCFSILAIILSLYMIYQRF